MSSSAPRMLRLPDVQNRTGLKRSTLYLRMQQGSFPRPVPLGSAHVVGWVEAEIDAWLNAQIKRRDEELADAAVVASKRRSA